jgi:hypothetical protein
MKKRRKHYKNRKSFAKQFLFWAIAAFLLWGIFDLVFAESHYNPENNKQFSIYHESGWNDIVVPRYIIHPTTTSH